jgi:hypothetical protein
VGKIENLTNNNGEYESNNYAKITAEDIIYNTDYKKSIKKEFSNVKNKKKEIKRCCLVY